MTISLKVRTKKLSEDDIILNIPEPPDEKATWVWRMRGTRSEDIMFVEMLDKSLTVVTIWDYVLDAPKRLLVKEPYETVVTKWELSMAQPIFFQPDEEEEDPSKEEDDD